MILNIKLQILTPDDLKRLREQQVGSTNESKAEEKAKEESKKNKRYMIVSYVVAFDK
jgi:hypothetical protein